MADCFPPESDDLHRRWLPREIFADIGIVDSDSAAAVTEPTPEAAAAAAVEAVAAQLAGILGGGSGGAGANMVWPLASPPPPPAYAPLAAAAANNPCHGAKVCGLEGNVVVTTNGGGGGAVSWPPFVPYPQQLQWQVGGLVNHGGVLDYPLLPPALPCHVPPPANLRAGTGTGVFLPRVDKYRYPATPATAPKGGAVAKPSWVAGTGSRPPAPGKKQQQQPQTVHATPTKQQHQNKVATGGELALPQDWSYR